MNSAKLPVFLFCVLAWLMISEIAYAQSDEITGIVSAGEIIATDRIFEIYINRYEPDPGVIEYLKTQQDSVTLYVFLGSWCRETKKYIPGLMKTLRLVESPFIRTNYVAVDAQKKIPKSFLKKFEIKYIPTVVVLKGNEEIGRIVEKPLQPIETDLMQILTKALDEKD